MAFQSPPRAAERVLHSVPQRLAFFADYPVPVRVSHILVCRMIAANWRNAILPRLCAGDSSVSVGVIQTYRQPGRFSSLNSEFVEKIGQTCTRLTAFPAGYQK